jgi:hypothetical protein
MTDPLDDAPAAEVSGARRGGVLAGLVGVLALVGALVVLLAGGRPYSTNVAGGLLYLAGLGIGLTGSVLLWMAWSEQRPGPAAAQDGRSAPPTARTGAWVTAAALLLICACAVVSLTDVASGPAQLWLLAVTAAVLAAAVALAPPTSAPNPPG